MESLFASLSAVAAAAVAPTTPLAQVHGISSSNSSSRRCSSDSSSDSPLSTSSGNELSFVSDAESNDSLSTPPRSPTRIQQAFRRSIDSIFSDVSDGSNDAPDRRLSEDFSSLSLDFSKDDNGGAAHEAMLSGPVSISEVSDPVWTTEQPRPSDKNFFRRSSANTITLPTGSALPITPTRSRATSASKSLSAKRANRSPGVLDLSNLPRFPIASSLQGGLTPHAAGSPLTGSGSGSGNGSTPRALLERPGLLSRWSTDSESGGESVSSCASSDCEACRADRSRAAQQEKEGLESRLNNDDDVFFGARVSCHLDDVGSGPSNLGGDGQETIQPPHDAAEDDGDISSTEDRVGANLPFAQIRSPVAIDSPSAVTSILPPAPKPHQHGFSPFAFEAPALGRSSSASSVSYFTITPQAGAANASPAISSDDTETRQLSKPRRCRKSHKGTSRLANVSDSGFSAGRGSTESPPSSPCPEGLNAPPTKPLTRSQGLRIKDEGSRPRSRYHGRSLSQTLALAAAGGQGSSTAKTASALIDGTISPAETTTDPLRVRLREMPGARTPEISDLQGRAQSPSRSGKGTTGASYPSSSRRTTGSNRPHQQHQQQHSNTNTGYHGINKWSHFQTNLPRSPLHITSLPDEIEEQPDTQTSRHKQSFLPNQASASVPSSSIPPAASEELFTRNFSLANSEGPSSKPRSPLASPKTHLPMPALKEDNPYFAGFA